MRVTIEIADSGSGSISADPKVYVTETGQPGGGVDAPVETETLAPPGEAVDGGAPPEELLAALGAHGAEQGDDVADVAPDDGYGSSDGSSAGAPPDWLQDLLGGRGLS